MKVQTVLSFACLPVLASAHDVFHHARHANHARQAPAAAAAVASSGAHSSSPSPASSAAAPPAQSGPAPPASSGAVPPASSGLSASAAPSFPPISVSLQSTNPTAIPLASITAGSISQATEAFSTPASGAQPTVVPGAPPLPSLANINPANYPPLDKPPPTDSPQVLQWIQEVQNSGVNIPNITPTVAGGCPANLQAAADTTRCWWTCGGCTRNTDVTTCPDPMTWGLTYDDGPATHTPELLDYLNSQNLKSTFFVVGSRVISSPPLLQAEYMAGHQIAVHTWSHPSLTTLTNEEIIAELGWSKQVIRDVLGVTPNMMRPPYGDIDDRVRAICIAMGLTPVIWTRISASATFDTNDFNINGGLTSVQQVLQNWQYILGNVTTISTGFIVLEHDLFPQSVDVATGYILPDALAHNPPFSIKPVITCLNKPNSDAYIETNNNVTSPPPAQGSGVVTLSSGAPGSAQATGKSSSSASSLMGSSIEQLGLVTVALAGLVGAGALLY